MFTIRSDQNQIVQCPLRPLVMERKWKPNIEIAPNCPRCASSNTKFCYYNNYSLSQPRYFCKGCRRYWTKGGSLRNVPVGGGCRKSRSRSSRSSSERIVTNFVPKPPSPGQASNEPLIGSPRKGDGAADIDLAAVFAKFLNRNSGSDDSSSGANSLVELPLDSLEFESQLEDIMVESQMTSELIMDGATDGLLGDFPLISNADNNSVHVFSNQDSDSFGLQSLISNELPQEGLWSDGTILRSSITWQPMVQLQEFEGLSSDDQLKVSTNLVGDNWSLFDLPGCEIFSRP